MHKILSVDDEPINQAIVEELLGTQFDIALLSSGEECLSEVENIQPELILLDVSMPGIDGYDTCKELKTRNNTQNIPILFVSARSTLEDKIKGYEAGGHDYITKPFNHAELESKIKQTIKANKQEAPGSECQSLANNQIQKMDTPFIDNEKILIQFLGASFNCHSAHDLGQLLLNLCHRLQLDCIIQLRSEVDTLNFSSSHPCSPLELSLIEQSQNKERCLDFNSHTLLNTHHVSLLIKNMPSNELGHYEGIKAWLGVIIDSIESKLAALNNENRLTSLQASVFEHVKNHLTEFEQQEKELSLEEKLRKIQITLEKLFDNE